MYYLVPEKLHIQRLRLSLDWFKSRCQAYEQDIQSLQSKVNGLNGEVESLNNKVRFLEEGSLQPPLGLEINAPRQKFLAKMLLNNI